jgi:hypothetical protein
MPSNKHLLVSDTVFELVTNMRNELKNDGIEINICDVTNLAIKKGINDAKLLLEQKNKME